jgi:hypothetical protein
MPTRKELPGRTFLGKVESPLLENERVTRPHANRLSDAAFVALLGVFGLTVALIPVPGWLRMVGFDVLLAVASGVTLYLVLKYATRAAYPPHGSGVQRADSEPVRDGLAVGYTLLVLVWAGLAITVVGDMTVGVGGGLAGAALSGAAGLLLLLDFHGATSGIARSDAAVNFILKPAWLRPSRISQHERMALGRATGMAWLVGAVIDVVTTLTK